MALEDSFPFKSSPAPLFWEHEVAPSSETQRRREPRPEAAPTVYEGRRGSYRLAFRAMEVPGFPNTVRVGDAEISQGLGPLRTRVTHINQKPGWRVVYEKQMEYLAVGEGTWMTLCQLDVTVPSDLTSAMTIWRDQALGAVSVLVALLDERVAQELMLEDLLIYDETGEQVVGSADHIERVRKFPASTRVLAEHRAVMSRLSGLDLAARSPTIAASRWYLRAAQLGPTPDAVVFLWIAAEALAKPPYGTQLTGEERGRGDAKWVELAIEAAGAPLNEIDPNVGRLADLRAAIVHGGVEDHPLVSPGYYMLEVIVRLLIRHRFNLGPYGWPLAPGASNLIKPLRAVANAIPPKTVWLDPIWRVTTPASSEENGVSSGR